MRDHCPARAVGARPHPARPALPRSIPALGGERPTGARSSVPAETLKLQPFGRRQWLLLAVKVDGDRTAAGLRAFSWGLVLLPLWVGLAYLAARVALRLRRLRAAEAAAADGEGGPTPPLRSARPLPAATARG